MKRKVEDKLKDILNKPSINIDAEKIKADEELRQNLLFSPDQLEKKSYSDPEFDQYNLRQELLKNDSHNLVDLIGGEQVDLDVLASEIQRHPSQFKLEYYIQVFKILNLTGNPSSFIKDKKVANFTVEVIYGRYKKEILPTIQAKNKYVGHCIREYKYYQFFTKDGIDMLQTFIRQAIDTMIESNSYYDFRIKMYKKYDLPYQIEIGL